MKLAIVCLPDDMNETCLLVVSNEMSEYNTLQKSFLIRVFLINS